MLLLLLAQAASLQPLNLTCLGAGSANKISMGTVNSRANVYGSVGSTPYSGYGSATTNVYIPRQQAFEDQVDLRLFAGDDRIRLPRTMLPPIHGGDDGWFKLKNVTSDSRSIKAKVGVNFMNSPNVNIDRNTGVINISGKAGSYTGQCQAVTGDDEPRF